MNISRRIITVAISAAAAAAIAATSVGVAEAAGPSTVTSSPAKSLVIIDASADNTDALAAMKLASGASDLQFTATTAPTFATTGWKPVLDGKGHLAPAVTGGNKNNVTQTMTVTHEETNSWSLGGSVEASVGFNLLDVVDAELSAKFTANHTWTTATADSQTIEVTAKTGKTVWIEASNSTATYTGNFTFSVNGSSYEINNVTITQPATNNTGTEAAAAYEVEEMSNADLGIPANTKGGLTPINALPRLRQIIDTHDQQH